MKLSEIEPGSEAAYRQAAKIVIEQIEFELETCQRLLGIDPVKLMELLGNTPDWSIFTEDDEGG
jgi:hypothetical protein